MTRQQKTVAKIIEVKEFNTEQLEAEVKKARARLNIEEEKLAGLEREYLHTCDDFSYRQTTGTLPVQEMDLFYTYLKHLTKQIGHQKCVVSIHIAELEQKQEAMVTAYKEQRLFEILQDKMHQVQAREAMKKEQKEADYQFLTRKAKE